MHDENLVEYDVTLVVEQTISTKVTASKRAEKEVIEKLAIDKWSDGEIDILNSEVTDISFEEGASNE